MKMAFNQTLVRLSFYWSAVNQKMVNRNSLVETLANVARRFGS